MKQSDTIKFSSLFISLFFLTFTVVAQAPIRNIQDFEKASKKKMDDRINSSYYEGAPMLSADGKTLYIYRAGHPSNIGIKNIKGKIEIPGNPKDEDIWYSVKSPKTGWSKAKNIGPPLNTRSNSAVCGASPDGNILYVYDFYTDYNFTGLAVSTKGASGWSTPRHVNVDNFYLLNTLLWLHVSADGQTLLMSLERIETQGMSDLYVSFRKPDGSFTEPKNLGPVVNSNLREMSPFLAADNRTLYYASEGKPGYGNLDIFVTRRLDDTWQNWSVPENLGPNINTANWDTELSVSADGKEAYMISGGKEYGDNSDVYKVELPVSARPSHMRLVYGYVRDYNTQKPLQGYIHFLDRRSGKEAARALSDPATGYYKTYLSDSVSYTLNAEKSGYFAVVEQLDIALVKVDSLRKDLLLATIRKGGKVDLGNIYFEQSKYAITSDSDPQLTEIAKLLKETPSIRIMITGHTDNVGNTGLNQKLSLDRATEVKRRLTEMGISPSRIEVDGKGGSNPVAPNDTEENKKRNRRVEFLILDL